MTAIPVATFRAVPGGFAAMVIDDGRVLNMLTRAELLELAAAATAAFQSWEAPIAAALREEGVEAKEAEAFAGLVVSTIEGALIRARAAGDEAPLDSAVTGLHRALGSLLAGRAGA